MVSGGSCATQFIFPPVPSVPSSSFPLLTSERLGRPKSASMASSSSAKGNSITTEGGEEDAAAGDTPPSYQDQPLEKFTGETPNGPSLQGELPRVTFAIEASSSPEENHLQHNRCERPVANAVLQPGGEAEH